MKAIQRLPISKRMLLVEKTLRSIRENETKTKMEKAAKHLLPDYRNDQELTSFTALDFEDFYETR